ncbi:hypothetical protein T484DRAFT_1786620 [Baffinella frigidus]|nr:hypothetical protein T484DRAFT_1786620 [Cryptophyta sp. CCMP2293]
MGCEISGIPVFLGSSGGRKTPENNAPLSVVGAGKGQRPVNPFRRGSDGFPESDSPLDGVFLTSTGDEEDRREQPHWGHARTGLPSSTARERSLGGRPNDFAAHSPTVAFSPAQDADASTRHASGNAFPSQRAQSAARHRPDQAPDDDALFRWTDQAPRPGTAPLAGERRRSASPAVGTASPSVGAALWQRTTNSMHAVGLAATAVARLQQRKRQPPSTSGLRHAALKCENAVLNYRHLSRPITPGGSASLGTTGKYGDGARDAVLIALKVVFLPPLIPPPLHCVLALPEFYSGSS